MPINATAMTLSYAEAAIALKPLVLFVLGMAVYSIFIFKFYKFIAKKDLFELDLSKYNRLQHPALNKIFASILYLIEYVLLFPLFVFFWFGILTMLLAFLSQGQTIQSVTLIAIALVAVIRIASYYNESLSGEVAKVLPFALLGIMLTNISSFSITSSLDLLKQIPTIWSSLVYYLLFVLALEFILRMLSGMAGAIFGKKKYSEESEDQ